MTDRTDQQQPYSVQQQPPPSASDGAGMGVCARCTQPAVVMVTDAPGNGRCAEHAEAIFHQRLAPSTGATAGGEQRLDSDCPRCGTVLREHHDIGESCFEALRLTAEVAQLRAENRGLNETIAEWQEIHGTFVANPEITTLRSDLAHAQAERDRFKLAFLEGSDKVAQLRTELAERDALIAELRALKAGIVRVEIANRLFGSNEYVPVQQVRDLESQLDTLRTGHPRDARMAELETIVARETNETEAMFQMGEERRRLLAQVEAERAAVTRLKAVVRHVLDTQNMSDSTVRYSALQELQLAWQTCPPPKHTPTCACHLCVYAYGPVDARPAILDQQDS